jgi:hypothetical protein
VDHGKYLTIITYAKNRAPVDAMPCRKDCNPAILAIKDYYPMAENSEAEIVYDTSTIRNLL